MFPDPGGVHRAGVLRPMIAVVHKTVRSAMRSGPRDRLLQRLQWQPLHVHGRGARPADDASGEHVGDERRVAERAVGHAHVGDVGHVKPVRSPGLEPALHQIRLAAGSLGRLGGDGRPAMPDALDAKPAHDAHRLVAADLDRIPALRQ